MTGRKIPINMDIDKDGNIVPKRRRKSASERIRERKSKRTRAVSPKAAKTLNSIRKT